MVIKELITIEYKKEFDVNQLKDEFMFFHSEYNITYEKDISNEIVLFYNSNLAIQTENLVKLINENENILKIKRYYFQSNKFKSEILVKGFMKTGSGFKSKFRTKYDKCTMIKLYNSAIKQDNWKNFNNLKKYFVYFKTLDEFLKSIYIKTSDYYNFKKLITNYNKMHKHEKGVIEIQTLTLLIKEGIIKYPYGDYFNNLNELIEHIKHL